MRNALLLAAVLALSAPAFAEETIPTIVVRTTNDAMLPKLIERAQQSMDDNDVVAARLLLKRGLETGNAVAIRMYAQTMDPTWLVGHVALGGQFANPETASHLYKYAADLGDPVAVARWADLSSVDDQGCKKVAEGRP